ncbi:hypothetical protein BJF87_12895 [Gordonia sp. CNJ-863]|uniref:hypothetical protein n=1 Tax=Gordonia TaxID=2053 RepID=UPI000960E579|nr:MULTISPECIES: hypothetical protein [unclassified Gordonia (in: high G+C Gram-positive bacteria)]MCR8897710.1 hypothetical protein [Gordonia sp. GONU]OLT52965.1 hypothetical protein BJF87_12895 [Gordonia sp. CNJ-863]
MFDRTPPPVLTDGGDWWLLVDVTSGFATGAVETTTCYCKVLQWERCVDADREPALVGWLSGKLRPVRADRIPTDTPVSPGHYVRLTREDIDGLVQAGKWKTIDIW